MNHSYTDASGETIYTGNMSYDEDDVYDENGYFKKSFLKNFEASEDSSESEIDLSSESE
ncbi:hypothetical protein [Nostoc sp. FACHB-888]|uniref:hypothetical protein n=1 Tax=Nostoc sp. FACHB-888 TaxID=2692842 RepID=UPI00168953CE|nr:hypothetical protein [Nostoc sp. FACHB-888]MBD2248781.1 hypothetical protein [Nostoc sp. FACHB-888]